MKIALTTVAVIVGLALAAIGFLEFFAGGMSDDPVAGDAAGKKGCTLFGSGVALVIVALALALSACATTPKAPEIKVVEVDKPVAVQPIRPEQVPAMPQPLGPRPATASQAADAALAKVCEFVAYALKADPLLRISAGEKPVDLPRFPECETKGN